MLPTILLALLNMFKKYLHFTVLCSLSLREEDIHIYETPITLEETHLKV